MLETIGFTIIGAVVMLCLVVIVALLLLRRYEELAIDVVEHVYGPALYVAAKELVSHRNVGW